MATTNNDNNNNDSEPSCSQSFPLNSTLETLVNDVLDDVLARLSVQNNTVLSQCNTFFNPDLSPRYTTPMGIFNALGMLALLPQPDSKVDSVRYLGQYSSTIHGAQRR